MALLPIFMKAYWSLMFMGLAYFICLGLLTFPEIQKKYHSHLGIASRSLR
jgi:hypothetical protein